MKVSKSLALFLLGCPALFGAESALAETTQTEEADAAPANDDKKEEEKAADLPDVVSKLTSDTFQDHVDAYKYNLVKFYAPWCGHCKAMVEPFKEAARKLDEEHNKDANKVVSLADVDATAETDLAERFQVQGYPTLLFFVNGSPSEYSGPRTAAGIAAWVNENMKPALVTVADEAELAVQLKKRKPSECYWVYKGDESVQKLADAQADITRSLGVSIYLKQEAGADKSGNLMEVHKGNTAPLLTEEQKKSNPVTAEVSTLKQSDEEGKDLDAWPKWARAQRIPQFGQITEDNYEIYVDAAKKGMFWVCLDPTKLSSEMQKYGAGFTAAAKELVVREKKLQEEKSEKRRQEAEEKGKEAVEALEKEIAAARENGDAYGNGVDHNVDSYPMVWIDAKEFEAHAKEELGCSTFPTVVLQRGDLLGDAEETKVDKFVRHFGKKDGDRLLDSKCEAVGAEKEAAKEGEPSQCKQRYEELDQAAILEFFEDVRTGKLEAVPEPDELDLLDEEEPEVDEEAMTDAELEALDDLEGGEGADGDLDDLDLGDKDADLDAADEAKGEL